MFVVFYHTHGILVFVVKDSLLIGLSRKKPKNGKIPKILSRIFGVSPPFMRENLIPNSR